MRSAERREGGGDGGVLPRADRRLLRARRPAAPAVAGLRRRHRGARRARRVLRRMRAGAPAPACRWHAVISPVSFEVVGARVEAVRGRADAHAPPAHHRRRRRAGARDRAALPDPDRAAAAPLRRRRGGAPDRAVRRDAAVGRHAAAVPVDARRHDGHRASPAPPRSICRSRAPTTSRSRPRSTSTRSTTARSRIVLLFSGTVFARGDAGLSGGAGRRGARRRRSGCPVQRVARHDGPATSRTAGWLRLSRDTLDALHALQGPTRAPADVGRDVRAAAEGSGGGG